MVWDDTNPDLGNSIAEDIADLKENANTYFLDEDNMASDSATAVASQQSVKAYVDSGVTARPCARMYLGSDQTPVAASSYVKVEFDTEDYSVVSGEVDTSNHYYTATYDGKYLVKGSVNISGHAARDAVILRIYNTPKGHRATVIQRAVDANSMTITISDIIDVDAANNIEIDFYHNSANTITIESSSANTFMSICKVA